MNLTDTPLADALEKGRVLMTLTRTQMRIFKALREHGMVFTEDYRRLTFEPLLDAELAYESQSGHLRISPKGEAAIIVHGSAVLA